MFRVNATVAFDLLTCIRWTDDGKGRGRQGKGRTKNENGSHFLKWFSKGGTIVVLSENGQDSTKDLWLKNWGVL